MHQPTNSACVVLDVYSVSVYCWCGYSVLPL